MKIKKLKIENLASIGEAEINFDSPLLSSEPLFLICGETGAGKSTLLDAICLALYDELPRLSVLKKESFEVENDLNLLDTSDSRNILRRGTVSGFSEVDFIAVDGDVYRARWSVRRGHYKLKNKIQERQREIIRVADGQVLASKKNDCKELILQLVGLDFNQFTRTVMLAQNQFSKFLYASEADKSSILEMLTGTIDYSLISKYIYEEAKQAENKCSETRSLITSLNLLTPEELSKLESLIKEIAEQKQKIEQQIKELEKKLEWISKNEALKQKIAELEKQRFTIEQKEKDLNFIYQKRLAHRYDETTLLRNHLRTKNSLARKEKQQDDQEYAYLKIFVKNLECFDLGEKLLKEKEAKLNSIQEWIEKHNKNKEIYESEKTLIIQFEQLFSSQQKSKQILREIENLKDQTIKYKKELFLLEKEEQKEQLSYSKVEEKLKKITIELEASNYLSVQKKSNQIKSLYDTFTEAIQLFERWNELYKQLVLLQQEKEKTSSLLLEKDEIYIKAKEQTRLKLAVFEEASTFLSRQKLSINEMVKEMRSSLKEGEPCPVCGSIQHIFHDEEKLNVLIENARVREEETRKEKEDALMVENKIQVEQANLHQLLEKQRKEIQLQEQSNLQQKNRCENLLKKQIPSFLDEDEFLEANKIDLYLENLQEKLGFYKTEYEKVQKELEKITPLYEAKDQCQKEKDVALLKWQAAKEKNFLKQQKQQELLQKMDLLNKDYKEREDLISQLIEEISRIVPHKQWEEKWSIDPSIVITNLREATKKWNQSIEKREQIKQTFDDLKLKQLQSSQWIDKMYTICPDWRNCKIEKNVVTERTSVEKLPDDLSQLYTDTYSLLKLIAQNRKEIKENEKAILDQLESYNRRFPEDEIGKDDLISLLTLEDETINAYKKNISQLEKQKLENEADLKSTNKVMLENQQDPMASADEKVDSLKEQLAKFTKELEQYNEKALLYNTKKQQQIENKEKQDILITKLQEQQEVYKNWYELNNSFGSKSGNKFRNIAQSYTLRFLLEKANYQLQQLNDRYLLRCVNGSLGLLVEDNDMGGDLRPASTLSGGESFLVSLALALGLSSLTDEHLNVETLFIDEGFGSLSEEYLSVVMDALEHLHNQGRKVGIISHVSELRDRIPVQVQVKRIDQSRSSVSVVKVS